MRHTPHLAIIAYGAFAIAVWRLRRRNVRSDREPFLMPGGPTVPVLACIVIAWIFTQTITMREIVALGAVLGLSLVVYLAKRRDLPPGRRSDV